MTESHPPSFLNLSVELRLLVYQHLLTGCLADGAPAGFTGLFLSCREIHHELEAEFSAKIRPLLVAQNEWRKAWPKNAKARYIPLRLKLSHQNHVSIPTPAAPALTIVLPSLQSWLFNTQAWVGTSSDLWENAMFKRLLKCLRPILRLPWSVLTLNLGSMMTHISALGFYLTAKLSEAFFICLARLEDDGACNLDQIGRLVLNYGGARDKVDECHFQVLFQDFQSNWRHSGSPNVMPNPKRGWICRQQGGGDEGWKLVFDYRDELGEVDSALWEIAKEDEYWTGKRLFEGDLDEVTAGYLWEQEYRVGEDEEEEEEEDTDDNSDSEEDEEDGN